MSVAIRVENVSKAYRLGQINTGTLSQDLQRWWALKSGKEDPFLKIGELNDRTTQGSNKIVWSLKDISFDVKEGESIGIIGRNGAGKSTLLKLLSQITAPTIGNIKIKGRIASLLEVGTGFHPELSGRENVYLNGAILGMRKEEIRRKFDEIVHFSGVERYIDTPVKRYSSGMYVRLAFAVAAHLESEILIVDEVLAVGDAEFQKKCIDKMNQLGKDSGRTIFFVSHNMTAIRQLCSSSIYLNKGQVDSIGDTQSIVSHYLTSHNPIADSDGRIPDDRRLHGTGEARFRSVLLYDQRSELRQEYYFGDRITVKIELEAFKAISNVSFGLHLLNVYGERVAMITQNNGYLPIRIDKGHAEITITIDETIMPGDYSFALSLSHHHSGADIDFVESFSHFKIHKEAIDKDSSYPWATVHGYFKPKAVWALNKIEK